MLDDLPIRFENPVLLWLLLLLIPTWFIGRLGRTGQTRGKFWTSFTVRAFLVGLLAMALARPSVVEQGESVTLMVVADVSRSIPRSLQRRSQDFLTRVEEAKQEVDDRIGVVSVARAAEIQETPNANARIEIGSHAGDLTATDLSDAISTAVSIMPTDTANRILLVSDGNETEKSIMEAVELARVNGIPVDVFPIEYEHTNEVVFEGLRAPARARLGQSIDLKAFLRTGEPVRGTLRAWQNDQPLDLDPSTPGEGVVLDLESGPTPITIPVSLDSGGAQRFRAEFTPENPEYDRVSENNTYEAVTFVGGDGRVLIIDDGGLETSALSKALRDGGIEVLVEGPDALTRGNAYLNGFDAMVLANIPRWAIDAQTDRAIHSWVHDLGGGLLMLGGDQSFGAGGWIDSEVAKALPVRLDPPQERQMVRGALALIMHSCEMAQGNYWGQQVAIAGIEALSRLDYIGIVTFNFAGIGPGVNGSSWAFPLQLAGDKQAAIAAAKKMVVGDMPDFASAFTLAHQGLNGVNAGQKHVIVISDGDPQPPSRQLLDSYVADGITVTTVMVAGHGSRSDQANMKGVAEYTGGTFYNVTNPKALPKIFIKEATLVSRTLIIEGDFIPGVQPTVAGPTRGVNSVPPVGGFVLTMPKEGLVTVPITVTTEEGEDPLLAWWNYGLGKSIAFTSDVSGRWGREWAPWGGFQGFWEQVVRWTMRPAAPPNLLIRTRTEGETAIVEVEAMGEGGGFADFLQGRARVLQPDGTVADAALQQIGPGRYRGEFEVSQQGAYLVNVLFPNGEGGVAASVQAAVSVPYSKEFATVRDNRALMESVAERTGGRVLESTSDLELVNPFDRTGLEMPFSPTRIWDLLAIIAAGLFVLDVAVRRISIDTKATREAAQRALASKTQGGGESVSAWRKARSRSRRKRGEEAAPTTRFEGEEHSDFSIESDTAGTTRTDPIAQRSTQRKEQPPEEQDEGDMTSRLLRAKRRAKGGGSNADGNDQDG
ncbi:MAG: VWA domain-containing protein [Phycisphaerales bacterium]|nr:VWA domain-containing protein [Phycisphaerales bacterium]